MPSQASNSIKTAVEDDVQRPLLATEDEDVQNYGTQASHVEEPVPTFTRQLNAFNGFALLISVIIGSGIFASPGQVDSNVSSPGAALLIWLLGGVLAWTGAATLASLGTAFPGEGGIQQYLTYIYGDVAGFLAAWAWITAVMPATLAILNIVFVESIYSAIHPASHGGTSGILYKLLSVLVLVVMVLVNSISTKTSTRLGNVFVFVKLGSVTLLVLAGVVAAIIHAVDPNKDVGGGDWHRKGWFDARPTSSDGKTIDWTKMSTWKAFGHYSTAIYAGLWAYAGWDKANYVAGELRDPTRQLPLAINTALPTVILSYVLVNAAYYILLPWDQIALTDAIAVTAIKNLLGTAAGIVFALLICLVIMGALNGNIFVTGRLTVAAANKGYLPSPLKLIGRVGLEKKRSDSVNSSEEDITPRFDAPFNALILSTILSIFYILFSNFRALLTFDGMTEYTFFFLTVVGDLVIRYREPQLSRPYKPSILFPILFSVVSGLVVVRGAVFAPVQFGVLAGVLGVGVVWYYVWGTRERIRR